MVKYAEENGKKIAGRKYDVDAKNVCCNNSIIKLIFHKVHKLCTVFQLKAQFNFYSIFSIKVGPIHT